jgi:hypothetical protein
METPPQDVSIESTRRIVQYLIGTGKETYTSLMKKLNETTKCGYCEKSLQYFEQGYRGLVEFNDYFKRYYYETNNQSLVCPAPSAPETHWYDIFWSSRPSSGSSEGSKKNDRSATYRATDGRQDQPADTDHIADNVSDKHPLLKKNE